MENLEWKDKVNGADDIDAEDINLIARYAQKLNLNKVDKVDGKGLSSNDYTDADKAKLAGVEEGANKTVIDDALSKTSTNPLQNKVVAEEFEKRIKYIYSEGDVDFDAITEAGIYHIFEEYDKTNNWGNETILIVGNSEGYVCQTQIIQGRILYREQFEDEANDWELTWSERKQLYVTNEIGKGLSSNDYTDADKAKLTGVESGANKTVVDSELSETSTNPVQNKVTLEALNGKSGSIINSASGETIQLTDSAEAKLKGLNVYGKTTQNGTPTPETPIALKSLGENGNIVIAINEQSLSVSTPNGLRGILVATNGNYTDSNGQQWVCDEVDPEREVYIQRIGKESFSGSANEFWSTTSGPNGVMFVRGISNAFSTGASNKSLLCSHYIVSINDTYYNSANACYFQGNTLRISHIGIETVAEFKEWLSNNPIDVQYVLATPIETPLTEEQISAYKTLQTYYPTTNITNDENAGMKVDYVADTKNYIDNKFAELQAMILEV